MNRFVAAPRPGHVVVYYTPRAPIARDGGTASRCPRERLRCQPRQTIDPGWSTELGCGPPIEVADYLADKQRVRPRHCTTGHPPEGAPPPDGGGGDPNQAAAQPAPPPPAQSDQIVYPANGQSKDQQAADQYECHNWAKGQTGFDPTQPAGGVSQADADRAHGNYDRAMAACLTGRGYQVN